MTTNGSPQHKHIVNTFFFISILFVFLKTPAVATRNHDKRAELSSKDEELVKWASYGEEKLSTVVINGKLVCHVASRNHKLSNHLYPVSGASVAVFCGTSVTKTKPWAKGSTNSYGEFIIDLPSHLHSIPSLERICHVKVFHLPTSSHCQRAFNGKRKGIKLVSVGNGVRIYTTRNIHLIKRASHEEMRRGDKREHMISML